MEPMVQELNMPPSISLWIIVVDDRLCVSTTLPDTFAAFS